MKVLLIVCLLLLITQAIGPQAIAPGRLPLDQQLMQACRSEYAETSRLLLEQGADPNVRDTQNLTPLMIASIQGQPELVRLLLAHGADANAQSSVPGEKTALEAARYHRENDVERLTAVPNDPGGEGMRNQPVDRDETLKDNNYAEVIRLLKQAARKQQH